MNGLKVIETYTRLIREIEGLIFVRLNVRLEKNWRN